MSKDYQRIAQAIEFIQTHTQQQPKLEQIAEHVHLSPFHFQKLFSRWAGVSPKKYLQVLTVEQAKRLLAQPLPLLQAAESTGLSSSSRLHDHFVTIEALSPGEYKSDGEGLLFHFGIAETPFGWAFIAQTPKGVHQLSFIDHQHDHSCLQQLQQKWPKATFEHAKQQSKQQLQTIFCQPSHPGPRPLSLHVSGTNFQIQVWKLLLSIQTGQLCSYSLLAEKLNKPRAARAVGNAVGANPLAFIIPCHRVIQQNGQLGGYRWGKTRKRAMHLWEQAQVSLRA